VAEGSGASGGEQLAEDKDAQHVLRELQRAGLLTDMNRAGVPGGEF